MKILFVAFPYSIHAARWISLLKGTGWDIHLFPSQPSNALHEGFTNITFWPDPGSPFESGKFAEVRVAALADANREVTGPSDGQSRVEYLARVLDGENFDVVHSLEFQHAGYLTLDAMDHVSKVPPIWIATNYGADIALFGRDPVHEQRIRQLLARCDFYSSECRRDVELATQFSWKGQPFAVLPNSGGIDLSEIGRFRQPGKSSERRVIAVKGYQHFAGRALTALKALELCGDRLDGFEVKVFSPFAEVVAEVARLSETGKFKISCLPEHVPHEKILALHGSARVSIAISTADGISTALLEAMAMGSFPIQTCTACADEWIVDGESGFIVPPGDSEEIARKIITALEDDLLIDRAAVINERTIRTRADASLIEGLVVEAYRSLERKSDRDKGLSA